MGEQVHIESTLEGDVAPSGPMCLEQQGGVETVLDEVSHRRRECADRVSESCPRPFRPGRVRRGRRAVRPGTLRRGLPLSLQVVAVMRPFFANTGGSMEGIQFVQTALESERRRREEAQR